MSRIRTIKPEFWTSEQVMECSPMARLAFIGMWNFCDDQGVHPGSAKTLKAEVFPGDDIASACVSLMVNELVENGLICEFSAKGKQWWFVKGWHHQLIKNPSTPKYPAPPGESNTEDCPSPTPVLPQSYPSPTPVLPPGREGKGREGKRRGKERRRSKAGAAGSRRSWRETKKASGYRRRSFRRCGIPDRAGSGEADRR